MQLTLAGLWLCLYVLWLSSGLLCCTRLHSQLLLYLKISMFHNSSSFNYYNNFALCVTFFPLFVLVFLLHFSFAFMSFLSCFGGWEIGAWQFFHKLRMCVTNYCCQCSELKLNVSPTADFFFFSSYTDLLFQYCNVSHRLCFFITSDSRTVCSCWGESRLQACSRIWSFSIQPRSSTSSI